MPSQSFTITDLNKTITPGFTIKQIKIENPTPFYLYLNLSTYAPTPISSEYVISPNLTLITPEVNTLSITALASGINTSKGVVRITVYDSVSQQAASLPYQSPQFVGNFPSYPFTISAITTGLISLPVVNIERFQTVFIQSYSAPKVLNGQDSVPSLLGIDDSNGGVGTNSVWVGLGAYMPTGGVVSYVPRKIPENVTFLLSKSASGLGYEQVINVVQSPDPIDVSYPAAFQTRFVNNNGGSTFLSGSSVLPGFMLDISFYQTFAASENISLDIDVSKVIFASSGSSSFMDSFSINQVALLNQKYSIKTKLYLNSDLSVIRVFVTNNTVSAQPGIILEWNIKPLT